MKPKIKYKKIELEIGSLFRILGETSISASIWCWDGKYLDDKKNIYIVRRLIDDFEMPLLGEVKIVLIDKEDFEF